MLNKNYELVVVGQSFLNLIYALESLRNVKKVLVLEDGRLNFGRLYEHALTELDLCYLQTLGIDHSIDVLKDVKHYLTPIAVSVHWDKRRFLVGREPWDNICELYRVMPELFPYSFIFTHDFEGIDGLELEEKKRLVFERASFNDDCQQYLESLGLSSYRFKSLETIDIDFFLEKCPAPLKLLFECFKKSLSLNQELSRKFLYCLRGFFHKKFSSAHSDYEIFHLFLCLISKHYSLDQDRLRSDLVDAFVSCGGSYKKAEISSWRFFKSRPWSIELSSFEGIIHPDKMSFLGLNLRALNLKAKTKERFYRSVHVKLKFDHVPFKDWQGHVLYFSNSDSMACAMPGGTLVVKDDHTVTGLFAYRRKLGSKISFFKKNLKDDICQRLEEWYPGLSQHITQIDLSFGDELFIDDSFYYKTNYVPYAKKVALFDHSSVDQGKSLKLVAYHGPQKNLSFGFYGQLLDLKEGSYFQ